jgi:hypothetical protein
MSDIGKKFRYSGFVPEADPFHGVIFLEQSELEQFRNRTRIAVGPEIIDPQHVQIPNGSSVLQWAPTVRSKVHGFRPAEDCNGMFTPGKFQPHNNCYNYACNIASNSLAQPGRMTLKEFAPVHNQSGFEICPPVDVIIMRATSDGLRQVGDASAPFSQIPVSSFKEAHLVALLTTPPHPELGFHGDFHWVRLDDPLRKSWSQKNGIDQATDVDFSGMPITDPRTANWILDIGSISQDDPSDLVVEYSFKAWMLVPRAGVSIV